MLRNCENSYNATLGHNIFWHYKLSSRMGYGGSPCYEIAKTITMLRSGIFTLLLTKPSSRKDYGGTPLTIIFNFPFYIFNLKRISRTRQVPHSGEFFIYLLLHFVQALTQIIQHRGGLQAFRGERTYQQQPFQPFQRVFLLFQGMSE